LLSSLIAENMYTECHINGNQHLLFKAIVNHSFNESAVTKEEEQEPHHKQQTTEGCTLAVECKDGSTFWEKLADLKESFPIKVAEYAATSNLCDEPAFLWWVRKLTHQFGLEVPKTVKQAIVIDAENGNHLLQDDIAKEMEEVRVAFNIIDNSKNVPPRYQWMECHMIFYVMLDGCRWKAW